MICIIPARGGSKRVPRKNLQLLAGKSLVEWAIVRCWHAQLDPIVATDDEEIKAVAAGCGAKVHWRQPVADDQTTACLLNEVLGKPEPGNPKRWIVVEPTAPFLRPRLLTEAVSDSCVVVVNERGYWRRVGVYAGRGHAHSTCWEGTPRVIEVDAIKGIDINTMCDLRMARAIAAAQPELLPW